MGEKLLEAHFGRSRRTLGLEGFEFEVWDSEEVNPTNPTLTND